MTVTLAVKHMPAEVGRDGPVFVAGRLWSDATGARLFDWDDDRSIPLADPEACAAVRAVLPPSGEYLGGALMQVWVRSGPDGLELHGAYWLVLGDLEGEPASRWGPEVVVRPVPPEYDYAGEQRHIEPGAAADTAARRLSRAAIVSCGGGAAELCRYAAKVGRGPECLLDLRY